MIGLLFFAFGFFSALAAGIQDDMTATGWARLLSFSVVAGMTALLGYLKQPPPPPPPAVPAGPWDHESVGIRHGNCNVPPEGWQCSRELGHLGPCAALPISAKLLLAGLLSLSLGGCVVTGEFGWSDPKSGAHVGGTVTQRFGDGKTVKPLQQVGWNK